MTAVTKARGGSVALRKARMLIGGKWVDSAAGEVFRSRGSRTSRADRRSPARPCRRRRSRHEGRGRGFPGVVTDAAA